MRIAILTSGRFHVGYLARELAALGHDVDFYSLLPPSYVERQGIPRECARWLGPWVAPLYAGELASRRYPRLRFFYRGLTEALDRVASTLLRPCDALIAMSGMCLHTIRSARKRYGAAVFVERSSRHIESQRQIMAEAGGDTIPQWVVSRELAEYQEADFVTVLSGHAAESFVERGFDPDRLYQAMLGVDLDEFPATRTPLEPFTLIMVGTWCRRKGCDLLAEALDGLPNVRLLHVGPMGDLPFTNLPNARHVDAVPQAELVRYYAQAHALVLPSREDGFGMVLNQALACGLPIIASQRTGGPDLAARLARPDLITVVPVGDVGALREAIERSSQATRTPGALRQPLGDARESFTWRSYGEQYAARIEAALAERRARAR